MPSWFSVVAASVSCSFLLALSGTSPLALVLPAMVGVHALIGIGEAAITTAVVSMLLVVRPDLVHAWMFAANAYGLAAAGVCGLSNVVIAQRCVDPWKSRLQLAIDRAMARR